MKFLNEREIKYYEFNTEISEDEKKILKEYALKNIVNDDNALINYAIIDILKKQVDGIENE